MATINGSYQFDSGEQLSMTVSNTFKSDESDVNVVWELTNTKLATLETDMSLVKIVVDLCIYVAAYQTAYSYQQSRE